MTRLTASGCLSGPDPLSFIQIRSLAGHWLEGKMNRWAELLGQLPHSGQRLIARSQRISLPHGANRGERTARLRAALCRATAVRATYTILDPATKAALQDLRTRRGDIWSSASEFATRYGSPRPWRQLLADPTPANITERLLFLAGFSRRRSPATIPAAINCRPNCAAGCRRRLLSRNLARHLPRFGERRTRRHRIAPSCRR